MSIRKTEYQEDSREVLNEVLDRTPYGHLATLDAEGGPVVKPMNHVRIDDQLYFHGARQGERSRQLEGRSCFVTEQVLSWIPSSWRHAQLACPATTYYRSVMVKATPRVIEDSAEKARALQAFMAKYQPEGGYRPISAEDPMYRGPIQGVLVFALGLSEATCKVKAGQNMDFTMRRRVQEQLWARGRPGDHEAAQEMARVDPRLPDSSACGTAR